MGQIKVEKNVGGIEGLCVIEPAVHGDARGYFMETYNLASTFILYRIISPCPRRACCAVCISRSSIRSASWYALCAELCLMSLLILRSNSETYGKWHGVTLSAENKKQFLIPEGFAHGFLVLSDEAEFCYKVNDFWHPNDEGGMAWNDPEIGIEWPELKGEYKGSASAEGYTLEDGTVLNLSDKDQKWLGLKDTFKF